MRSFLLMLPRSIKDPICGQNTIKIYHFICYSVRVGVFSSLKMSWVPRLNRFETITCCLWPHRKVRIPLLPPGIKSIKLTRCWFWFTIRNRAPYILLWCAALFIWINFEKIVGNNYLQKTSSIQYFCAPIVTFWFMVLFCLIKHPNCIMLCTIWTPHQSLFYHPRIETTPIHYVYKTSKQYDLV